MLFPSVFEPRMPHNWSSALFSIDEGKGWRSNSRYSSVSLTHQPGSTISGKLPNPTKSTCRISRTPFWPSELKNPPPSCKAKVRSRALSASHPPLQTVSPIAIYARPDQDIFPNFIPQAGPDILAVPKSVRCESPYSRRRPSAKAGLQYQGQRNVAGRKHDKSQMISRFCPATMYVSEPLIEEILQFRAFEIHQTTNATDRKGGNSLA